MEQARVEIGKTRELTRTARATQVRATLLRVQSVVLVNEVRFRRLARGKVDLFP